MQGEAIGAGAIGDVRSIPVRWAGPWAEGTRPGQEERVREGARTLRMDAQKGSRIR